MATTSSIDLPTPSADTHRVDAPVWAFHVVVDYVIWAADSVRWFLNDFEVPVAGKHLLALVGTVVGLAASVVALAAFTQ